VLYGAVGIGGGYLVAVGWLGGDPGVFLESIRTITKPNDLWMGIIKATVFGFCLSAISCRHGFYASGGAKGVGQATTRAVVESCVTLLVVNYLITQLLFDLGW
jgi:phospholipid/cholesterol/gamma-HCH transport system permease protein